MSCREHGTILVSGDWDRKGLLSLECSKTSRQLLVFNCEQIKIDRFAPLCCVALKRLVRPQRDASTAVKTSGRGPAGCWCRGCCWQVSESGCRLYNFLLFWQNISKQPQILKVIFLQFLPFPRSGQLGCVLCDLNCRHQKPRRQVACWACGCPPWAHWCS